MDKKNVDTSAKKPSLFEIFKTQYIESDLGPISLNWFEELSSEAPPYDVKKTEDPLHKTMDQNTFKTPKGKLSINNSSVSTPMIFKDRNKNLKTFTSPIEKSAQFSEETGKTFCEMPTLRTQVDESNEGMNSSSSCVIPSPVVQEKQNNNYVLNESLLQTPKIFEVQTQKCISESLGAEADPDMSWSSSLATPPTLSPTVIIERRNDSICGTKIHNEIIDTIMYGIFSKYEKSLKSNNINRQSSSGIEISHAEMDSKIHNLESFLNDSFDKNAFPVELHGYQKPSIVSKDEDNHDGTNDFSLNIATSSVFLKKINSVEENKKALFYEKNHDAFEGEYEMIKASKESSNEIKYERKLKPSKCNLNINVSEIQNAVNRQKNMPSSLLCPWSQLDLSGLEITQLEKKFMKGISSSSNLQVKKSSPGSPSSVEKEGSSPKIVKSYMLNSTCLIQDSKLNSPKKLLVSENTPLLIKNDSTSLKHAEDEEFSFVKFSENNYFLKSRTLTEFSEVQSSCSDFSRKDKSSSSHLLGNISNQASSDDRQHTKSSLKNISSLSSLKRRPKKFIYALNNSLVQQEEGTTQKDGSLTCFVPVCTNLETGISELSEILIKNKGQIESADNHSTKASKQIDSEKCYTSANMLYKTPESKKSNIEHKTTDNSALLLKNNMKKETVMFSRDIAANYQTEVSEKGLHEICDSNTCVDRKTDFPNYSSSEKAFIEECTVPMQVSETENKQVTLELTAHSTKASKSKTMIFEKGMDTMLPPLLSLNGNKQRELGCFCHRKIQKFKGFKTASDKQIVLSADKIRKGKLLFKDIEDQLLEDFQNEEKGAISSKNKKENTENFSVGQNELNKHSCHFLPVSDSMVNSIHSNDIKICFPEYDNKSVQNVLKKQHPEEKQNLTASQVAEITELSNILEETDSQFEFTQFRKYKTKMYNNTNETRCFDKKCLNSKNWKDIGFVDDFVQKNPGDNQSSCKHIDTGECNVDRQSNEQVILLKSNRKENKCFVQVISDPLQSDLGNHSSVKNKDEITRRGTELDSNLNGMGETLNSYKIESDGSNKCNRWHMPVKEIDIDWPQKAKKGTAGYIIQGTTKDTIAFVKEDTENRLKDVDCRKDSVVQITSTTEVNLKIIQKYSVHVSENELLSTKNQNALPVHHFINCGKTCCNDNSPETLSDLTCLVEVAKTEKNTWGDASEKESFISEQEEKVNKPEKKYFLQSIHTVTDGNILAEKSKRLNLLIGSDIQEEINNMSYCKRKTNVSHKEVIPSMKENTKLNQTEIFGCNHENVSENREKQTNGFHTASGKQITFTDKSLLKARHILSEESLFLGNMNNIGNLTKPSVEDSVKKMFKFGEGAEKCREIGHSKDNFEDSVGVLSNTVKQGLKSGLTFKGLALNTNASESHFNGGKMEEACKSQDSKCDLHLVNTGTLQKYPTNEERTSTSKQLKVRPAAFSFKTASGKAVKVSPQALKNAQQFLHKNYSNLESHSETNKCNTFGNSLDAFGSKNCITSGYLNTEKMPMGYSDVSQFPITKELHRTAQTLPCAMPILVDAVSESNCETSDERFEMGTCFNTRVSTKGNCISDLSTDKCMFFSTASGKPVQLSKESLNKARQLFSEIEPNLSDHNFSCNEIHSVKNTNTTESGVNAEINVNKSGETCRNENGMTPKHSLLFLDISTLEKSSTSGKKDSPSKQLKARPVAFSFKTASGKTDNVSQEALKNAQRFLHKNLNDLESQSEANKDNNFGRSSDAFHNRECIGSSYLSVEKIPTEYSGLSQFPITKKVCEGAQTLSCIVPKSMESVPELSCKNSDDFIGMHMCSDIHTSNKKNCKSDFSIDNCGFFSTASGKPVQLSKESLKKASLLFSEIESDLSGYQNSVRDCSYDYNTVNSIQKKVFPRENRLHISQREKNPNIEVCLGIPCDFNTACGKPVQISQKALQNGMGLLKEFDDMSISACDFFVDENLKQTHNSPMKTPITKIKQHEANSSKPKEKCKTRENLNENETSKSLLNIEIPMCITSIEKYKQPAEFKRSFSCSKEVIEPLKTTRPCQSRVNTKYGTERNLDFLCPAYSQTPDNYSDVEASESAKAFIEDDDFTDSEVQRNIQKSILTANNSLLRTRRGKRHMEKENTFGQPPIKRKLLPEFDQSEKSNRSSFKSSRSSPCGIINDRKKMSNKISLKPAVCGAFSSANKRQEILNPNFSIPQQVMKGSKSGGFSERSSIKSLAQFGMILTEENKPQNHYSGKKTTKSFVPPFKIKSRTLEGEISNVKDHPSFSCKSINGMEEYNPKEINKTFIESEEDNCAQISALDSGRSKIVQDITKMTPYLQYARNLQQMRISKKQDQIIHPQPGSLYLVKRSSGLCRIPLKAAVKKKLPDFYSSEQLYAFGVSRQSIKINSTNAEDFQFLIQDFFSRKYFLEDHGIQLADGGYIIPNDEGKAGKEEFFWALCDTPGVDPNLISKAWVYNHYKWIIWKLAAMEVAFPQAFASKCLTPEGVLLQLKYRYDIEVDKSQRSAIKKITERDDVAGKTIILCISKIISFNTNMPHIADSKSTTEDNKKKVAIIEVTDGWYGIRAVLDPPLQSLLSKQKLSVGQKIVVHGAELVGSQDASTPLEAPESLMLKITANSTRRARWYAKLGYHCDPRPFSLPLSSLFSDGGTVGCIDVIVQRIYPIQWMEKVSKGSCVFRNNRAEQREATKFAANRQKTLEILLAKVQAKFEKNDDKGKRILRSHALTRQQIRALQDGEELYEAIINSADPSYMEGFFNEEQLKALNSHRQMVNDKRQAQIEAEFRKAVESAEQETNSPCRRDVSTIIKLQIVDYGTKENSKEGILNIWRPSSDVCNLLKEGGRYRILHLSASHSKGKLKTNNIQLTATKKTQYLQLPVSQKSLLQVYRPRECLVYSKLLEPSFRPACSEVDLVGYIVCLTKRAGFCTLVYLSDEHHNIIAIQICTELKQLAIEDIIIPSACISATNLQWRPEFKSDIPTLFAGELSAFSSNPKENHLQEIFKEFKNTIENNEYFSKDAEYKIMNLLKSDPLQLLSLSKECGLDPPWKSDAGNKQAITIPNSELRHQSPSTIGKSDIKPSFSLGSAKVTLDLQETPKNYKKRKAMDLLSQVPSPPPVKPICAFISPSLKKAFQPPRSTCTQTKTSVKKTESKNNKHPPVKLNGTDFAPESNFVADEELAMINTQALLSNFSEEQGVGKTIPVISRT
ncbi:breast cancer type 2 susceptibility protein isoform X1 [Crotalus tigris]|uniref:breast cancer type 2 susceptibility protein isoform X1 n=2 Tax=Crotalus tigris TaxID=88082 RepID=UPI00192F2F5F|nr:breast cancer type 2 susceptibility protein isoform X1 [Crotalus tigris]XP_039179501.1 breast cancer type 2 susceptibility protein isoform X1 [Crotalus tigris]XP_039179502.1 breast cancer type 2 susceptibility protein isoform X1 [Crotalus tigris]